MLYLIKQKYLFSPDLYLSIREAFWKCMTWCKLKINRNADKLIQTLPKRLVIIPTKIGYIYPVGNKPIGFLA